MAATDTIREWYHDNVVLNHHQRNTSGYEPVCNHVHPRAAFPREGGGTYNEPVHPLTMEAWQAYIQVMDHHGETMPGAGGVDQCRNIGTSNWPSLHAYLCACDLPPNSRKSAQFIVDIEKIRTHNEAQVFRNLAGDRMHDQINCSPADLATGIDWTTVIGGEDEDMSMILDALKAQDMAYYEALQKQTGSPGGNAKYWGSDYPGTPKPSNAEWVAAADELFAASLKAGVMTVPSAGVSPHTHDYEGHTEVAG